jgi:hypothetical protein
VRPQGNRAPAFANPLRTSSLSLHTTLPCRFLRKMHGRSIVSSASNPTSPHLMRARLGHPTMPLLGPPVHSGHSRMQEITQPRTGGCKFTTRNPIDDRRANTRQGWPSLAPHSVSREFERTSTHSSRIAGRIKYEIMAAPVTNRLEREVTGTKRVSNANRHVLNAEHLDRFLLKHLIVAAPAASAPRVAFWIGG